MNGLTNELLAVINHYLKAAKHHILHHCEYFFTAGQIKQGMPLDLVIRCVVFRRIQYDAA